METKTEAYADDRIDGGIWWSEYATKYDEFVVPLTCYQDNIRQLLKFLENSQVPKDARICDIGAGTGIYIESCLLYTSPSPRDLSTSRMPSSA